MHQVTGKVSHKNAIISLLALSQLSAVHATNQYQTWAGTALQELQTFYDNSTGLWQSFPPSWWQSGNALTTVANMRKLGGAENVAGWVLPNTFTAAAAFNVAHNHQTKRAATTQTDWTNGYYDDEGWWAMAWIMSYDATQEAKYLTAAEGLFTDMITGWGTSCSSDGLWWNKGHTEINPISNVLFMEVAANLAQRIPAKQQTYMDWARKDWAWLQQSGMWNESSHRIAGSIDPSTCAVKTSARGWTYAQGALIGALTTMSAVSGNQSYVTEAALIADSVIATNTVDGILVELGISSNPPASDRPAEQFKGVFMRGLMRLYQSQPKAEYLTFAVNNAKSIWANRNTNNNALGFAWQSKFVGPADASMHSSAMDALVAAWSMSAT